MRESIQASLRHLREFEGGFVNDPDDPGGCTNMGVTLTTYRRYVKQGGSCADLRAMPWTAAEPVYRAIYWDAIRGDDLPRGLDLVVFDHAVNAGPKHAVVLLQGLVGALEDGQLGPVTLDRIARAGRVEPLIARYTEARIAYYRSLSVWWKYGKGWSRRARVASARALGLLSGAPA